MKKTVTQPTLATKLAPYQQWLHLIIFLQALVAMVGSLYYSTFGDPVANLQRGTFLAWGEGFMPCELCWFARILMYPIVFISYVGIAKNDKRFTDYILPLSIIGIFLDSYHYALQKLPIANIFGCSLVNPCSALQVNYFGFVTIPFLALTAFVVISVAAGLNSWIEWKKRHQA